MNALVWHGERALALEELPEPVAAEGEVVVEVQLAGLCGSDLHGYRGHPGPRVPPLVLGHEMVGRVGNDTYTVYPLAGCGTCARCLAGDDNLCAGWRLIGMHRPGVFAERVAVPERSLVPLPAGLAPERAVLAEPLACCVGALGPHAVDAGTRVLVLGCGPIGLLTVFACARVGAQVTALDPVAERRAHATLLGAEAALAEGDDPDGMSFDLAIDAAGFEATWRTAVGAVRNGGAVVVVGLGQAAGPVPMAEIVRRSVHVRGQFAYSRADFAAAVEILSASDLDLGWIVERPLTEGADAVADLVDRPAEVTKVLLRP
jgi:threonine dehydrogenase-like Zn-dependent dehydrogenase